MEEKKMTEKKKPPLAGSASLPGGKAGFLSASAPPAGGDLRGRETAHKITSFSSEKEDRLPLLFGAALIILAGVVSGYFLSRKGTPFFKGKVIKGGLPKKIVGSKDASIFKDQAVGVIEKGGIDGEGTHKLLREGGPSQTAYLTSSVLDLDQFVGKKVRVWGETFAAQKAGWLMDIGRVEVLE